ncbi:hypothetical protein [Salsuginibacillus kocurii]|uniref:hypothetical protein n=1 Tax=Salsuginibacillus kocurii TaxID=427078 RepID=UPI000363268A|nr:hypothetical protein [Salsuginibacillus kocurii]
MKGWFINWKLVLLIGCCCYFLLPPAVTVEASEGLKLHDDQFMDIDLFAPSQTETTKVKVENVSGEKLSYDLELLQTAGSTDFFEMLEVTVLKNQEKMASGSLSDVHTLEGINISEDSEDEIVWELHFPEDKGNEWQGKAFQMKVNVLAERETDREDDEPPTITNPSVDSGTPTLNGVLPQTGESFPNFWYLIACFLILSGSYMLIRSARTGTKIKDLLE